MIAAETTFAEIVYVIPLGWSIGLLCLVAVAVGAALGAWLTTGALEAEVERRIALGIAAERQLAEEARR